MVANWLDDRSVTTALPSSEPVTSTTHPTLNKLGNPPVTISPNKADNSTFWRDRFHDKLHDIIWPTWGTLKQSLITMVTTFFQAVTSLRMFNTSATAAAPLKSDRLRWSAPRLKKCRTRGTPAVMSLGGSHDSILLMILSPSYNNDVIIRSHDPYRRHTCGCNLLTYLETNRIACSCCCGLMSAEWLTFSRTGSNRSTRNTWDALLQLDSYRRQGSLRGTDTVLADLPMTPWVWWMLTSQESFLMNETRNVSQPPQSVPLFQDQLQCLEMSHCVMTAVWYVDLQIVSCHYYRTHFYISWVSTW